jgi:hypothetical protein
MDGIQLAHKKADPRLNLEVVCEKKISAPVANYQVYNELLHRMA